MSLHILIAPHSLPLTDKEPLADLSSQETPVKQRKINWSVGDLIDACFVRGLRGQNKN